MNEQNNQQPIRAKFCKKCGTPLSPTEQTCSNCGFPVTINNSSQIDPPVLNSSNNEPNSPQKKNKKKIIIPIIIFIFLVVVGVVAFFLIDTHTICIDHSWEKADCTTPKTCRYCDKTEGEPLGHDWTEATCTEDSVCKRCEEIGVKAIGHTEGVWTVTKEATLVSVGVEEIFCIACSEALDSRTIEKKSPQVIDDSFNFTDEELIDWINDKSTAEVEYTELEIFDNNNNTSYRITMSDGEKGALMLNHGENGKDGNVCAIMVYFDDVDQSAAMVAWIGEKINSAFSPEDAFYKFYYGNSYTSANMSAMSLDLDDDFEVYILAPSEFLADIVS